MVHNALLGVGPLPRAAAEIEGLNHHRSCNQESPWYRRNLRVTNLSMFFESEMLNFHSSGLPMLLVEFIARDI